ncbi:MAG: DMT family transporter, partial [Xenococcaceae cyanobacterium]
IAVSSAAVFIRLAIAAAEVRGVGFSLFLAASRLIVSALILIPVTRKLNRDRVTTQAYYYAVAAGLSLALHFATWITSLSFTSIAASTTLVTTNPIWVALLSWWWLKEKPSKLTLLGMSIALIGGIIIAVGDRNSENAINIANTFLGNALALVGAFMASCYFLLGTQAQKFGLSIGNYIAIAYTTAAIVLLPLPLLFKANYFGYPLPVYFYTFLMAIVSQTIGHTSFNWALRHVSPTLVSLAVLFEPIGASLLSLFIWQEIPSRSVFLGATILLIGIAIAIIGTRKN